MIPSSGWMRVFGGEYFDVGYSVEQTTDGGYIVAGETNSFGAGHFDVWLFKTDSDGKQIWNRTFGGKDYDYGYSVQQTSDGGYIIAGETESFGHGNYDYDGWLIKTDSNGDEIWNKTLGGVYTDSIRSVQQTSDGGYILVGRTVMPYGMNFSQDVWLIKTDSNGEVEWNQTFGGTNHGSGLAVQQTTDGGYIITGTTDSQSIGKYDFDMFLIKTDTTGILLWYKTFGGNTSDAGFSVQQTHDGGYIISGGTNYYEDPYYYYYYYHEDLWLIKTDSNGNKEWDKTFGGEDCDNGNSVRQTTDGGYIITGVKDYQYILDVGDVWLIKTDGTGSLLWERTFGGANEDAGFSVWQTTDGGYIITGYTGFPVNMGDLCLIKTDENGGMTNPPDTPTITGETNGSNHQKYSYTILTTDPDNDDVKYLIDWGDNTTETTGLITSGDQIVVSHRWDKKGSYAIMVKAIDENFAESDWTTLTVTMPCSYNPMQHFFDWLLQRFPNAFPLLRQLLGY